MGYVFDGKIPKRRGGVEYLIVTVDYFTKWVEVITIAKITEANTFNFFHDQVLCRFGILRAVVIDHGTQFSSKFSSEYEILHIKH